MAEIESTDVVSASAGEDSNFSKQAACHECRRSKVKCVRPPDATTCKKCTSAGIECIVPKYHVGRYKGVKNKRSGLDKAIYQVEEAVKKARTKGTEIDDEHAQVLRRLLDETKDVSQKAVGNGGNASFERTVPPGVSTITTDQAPISVQKMLEIQPAGSESPARDIEEEGDVTVNNANNPLQLLAIASAIPEAVTGNPSPASNYGISPTTTAAVSGEDDDTRDFFSPMTSKLDIGKDLDPQDLGLVSDQEVEVLFA